MNVKQLKSQFTQNKKLITDVLKKYKTRYTTKSNIALYQLMVMALEAELQNVLSNIKYGKIDNAIKDIVTITTKYQVIAMEGNQNIAPTVKKFIGEIEYLYKEAINIEYEYYVQKERIKEEQRALREQMRREAEERKQLETERKKIEKEEEKYKNEIATISAQIAALTDEEKIKALEQRKNEINDQLAVVEHKKEEISNLQHGKAGYVYVVSNRGAFGDDVFKIGMTRRLEPMERIKELGDASVPFPFDIHSMIFSDDAVELERSLHKTLHNQRLNKVNLRKEFFKISIDELEKLVYSLQPTSEFNRTLLAEQYNQSISIDVVPESIDFTDISDDNLDDELIDDED